ncbi:hypothetical protein PIB30_059378 [Stylosanthes scabra]|uniref:Uncharacterized protein n=1 Tax=Stylosanthes scabra TaxID=79078 RepID=A0ABU6QJP2_9FABA|nr:hypothetical protein [Stylosanthes scabra]
MGFHHSPRLGMAGGPKAHQDQVAACSRRQQQPHDRAIFTLGREPNAVQSPTPRQTQVTTWFRRGSVRHFKAQRDSLPSSPTLQFVSISDVILGDVLIIRLGFIMVSSHQFMFECITVMSS